MLTFILIDDIERNNFCESINITTKDSIQKINNSDNLIQIKTTEDLKNYFNNKYNGIYDFLEDCYISIHSLNIILNIYNTNHRFNNHDKVEFYIINTDIHLFDFSRFITTPNYKYTFSLKSGKFIRWSKRLSDDDTEVKYSPLGPEIADIEISTICHGPNNKPCSWCYKSNIAQGRYMTLETYRKVLDTLNQNNTVTQVALGIGDIDSNPELEDIFEYTRSLNIVPNITINGFRMTDYYYDLLSKYCGAVSVSRYDDMVMTKTIKDLFIYNKFKSKYRTIQGINIHMILCNDTFERCMDFIKNVYVQNKLRSYVNAIIFLTMKPVGCRNNFKSNITEEQHKELIEYCLNNDIPIGFDSCGCYNFLKSIQNHENFSLFNRLAEPCESSLFSIYVNVDGYAYPCSFYEQTIEDKESYPYLLSDDTDLMMDIWFSEKFNKFRKTLLSTPNNEFNCRRCPLFNI